MQRLILLFSRRPWLWLALLLAASALAASQVGSLQVRISADEMLVRNDPQRAYHDEIKATFGEREIILLVVEDTELFAADKLAALRLAIDGLQDLSFVERIESLFNVPNVRGVDGYLDKTPFLAEPPASALAAQALVAQALGNPLIRDLLISTQGQAMAAAIVLSDEQDAIDDQQLTHAIERTIAPLRSHFREAYAVGFPQVRNEIADRIWDEQIALMPWAVAALLVALFLLLRQLVDVLIPLLTAGISILWTFGLMGWLGIPLNVVTSTVPILLIVVGSTEDIHLLAEFRHAQQRGNAAKPALDHMARKMGRTVLLTFLTSCAGFLSVGLSGIESLSQFGLVASTGLAFNFVVTIILIPAALALSGDWRLDGCCRLFDTRTVRMAGRYWRFLSRHRRHAVAALALCAVLAASGIPRIQTNHNPTDSLGRDSVVAAQIDRLNRQFAGLESFSIVIESGIQDTFLQARYLEQVVKVQDFVRALDSSLSVTSFADFLTLLNKALLESESAGLPASNDEIAELMLFLDHERISAYITEDYSRTRVVIRHDIANTEQLRALLKKVRAFVDRELDPGLSARVTGDSVLALSATDSMILGQLQSVLLILTLFVVIIAFLFTDLRVGLLAAVPNVFPVIILFGVMGYADIPLNIGTTMAAAIAIGIAVDDTLHFLLRYNQELRQSKSQLLAMENTLYEEALPVVSTSIALTVGFLVFALSEFAPVAQFGLLSALVIASALIADFVITPLIISSLRLVTLWDLLSSRVRQQLIPRSPLFRDMRPWQIRRFVLSSTLLEYKPGEYVYRQGDSSQALYLVMKGVVEITVPSTDKERPAPVVDRFASGSIFGDVALLADEPRKTDAVALSNTTLMVLTREAIANVTLLHPFIASRLFLNLARDVSCRWVSFIMRVRNKNDDSMPEDDAK